MINDLDLLRKLFTYDKWALGRSLSSVENPANEQALSMLAHILMSEKIWLLRLQGRDYSSVSPFQKLSLDECLKLSDELYQNYGEFLESLTDEDLNSSISYTNTQGEKYQTPVKDILFHVGLHAVYHRGQVALLVRGNGGTAINTDYMTFTRL